MSNRRSPPASTSTGKVLAMAGAQKEHAWPSKVVAKPKSPLQRDIAEQSFQAILHKRAHETWSDWDLQEAARMAVSISLYEINMRILDEEGPITNTGGKDGTKPVRNVRIDVCISLKSLVITGTNKLGLNPSQTERRTNGSKAAAEQSARKVLDKGTSLL